MVYIVGGQDEFQVRSYVRSFIKSRGACQLHEYDFPENVQQAVTTAFDNNLFGLPVIVSISNVPTKQKEKLRKVLESIIDVPDPNLLIISGCAAKYDTELMDTILFSGAGKLIRSKGWSIFATPKVSKESAVYNAISAAATEYNVKFGKDAEKTLAKLLTDRVAFVSGEVKKLATVAQSRIVTKGMVERICCDFTEPTITDAVKAFMKGDEDLFVTTGLQLVKFSSFFVAERIKHACLLMYQIKVRDEVGSGAGTVALLKSATCKDQVSTSSAYYLAPYEEMAKPLKIITILRMLANAQLILDDEVDITHGDDEIALRSVYRLIRGG